MFQDKKNVTLCNQKECQCLLPQKSQYFVALKDWQHSVTQKYFRQKEFEKCHIPVTLCNAQF